MRNIFILLCLLLGIKAAAQTPVIFTNELRLNPNALTPTTNGSINYLLSTHKLQARINGVTENIATESFSNSLYWKLTGTSTITTPTIVGDPFFQGNILIGSTGPITTNTRLDIRGDNLGVVARFANNANSELMKIMNAGLIFMRNDATGGKVLSAGSTGNEWFAIYNNIQPYVRIGDGAALGWLDAYFTRLSSGSVQYSTSVALTTSRNLFGVGSTINPSTGNAEVNHFFINPTYNTTGTYSGIIRGIYYNPTVTSLTGATHFALHATSGNVMLGNSTSDIINASTKLEVRALGSGSSSFGFRVIAANGNNIFRTRDDGRIDVGDQGPGIAATNGGIPSNVGRNTFLIAGDEGQAGDKITLSASNLSTNSGSTRQGLTKIIGTIKPTAGSAPHAAFMIENTINQTGGANGTTHGIYYNPTLTAVVGTHVAFENTSGQLRFGALTNDDTKTRILAVDNTTGQVFYRNATSITPSFGTAGQIPFINGTNDNFSYDADNKFVSATNIFTTGQNLTISQTGGTIDHATVLGLDHLISNNGGQIRWSTLIGEANKITSTSSTGHIANATLVGGNTNEIKNNGTFSIFNPTIFGAALSTIDVTAATGAVNSPFMICRRCESTGDVSYSYTFGHWTKTTAFGAIAMGISTTSNDVPTHEKVTAAGRHAVNISANSGSQTTGHGAYGDYSAILGGQDHDIPSTSSHSVILGGNGIKARASAPNEVYVPNLNIVSTPGTDNTLTEVLVRDGSVSGGPIKLRTLSSFVANGLNLSSGTIKLGGTLTGTTTINGGNQDLALGASGDELDFFEVNAQTNVQIAGSASQNTKLESGSQTASLTAHTASFDGGVYVTSLTNIASLRADDGTDLASVDVMPTDVTITANNTTVDSRIKVNVGVAQGTGIKHGRVTTGSIATLSSSLVTLTWGGSAFADTNYTCTCSVEDTTTSSASLSVVHIESKSTTQVQVRIENTSAGSITGTLSCIAIHD